MTSKTHNKLRQLGRFAPGPLEAILSVRYWHRASNQGFVVDFVEDLLSTKLDTRVHLSWDRSFGLAIRHIGM